MAFHITTDLIETIDATEFAYSKDRMTAVREVFGDPNLVCFTAAQNLHALMAPLIPNPYFNRILLSSPPSIAQMEECLNAFSERNVSPLIDVSPGSMTLECSHLLSSRGFKQTEFHPLFVRGLSDWLVPTPPLETRRVSTTVELDAFKSLYTHGWNISPSFADTMKRNMDRWANFSNWHLMLTLDKGTPISTAVLFIKGNIGYLADAATPPPMRGRGAQISLLSARVTKAKELGCEVIFSRADFGSSSHRNMETLGLPMAYCRAVWSAARPQT